MVRVTAHASNPYEPNAPLLRRFYPALRGEPGQQPGDLQRVLDPAGPHLQPGFRDRVGKRISFLELRLCRHWPDSHEHSGQCDHVPGDQCKSHLSQGDQAIAPEMLVS